MCFVVIITNLFIFADAEESTSSLDLSSQSSSSETQSNSSSENQNSSETSSGTSSEDNNSSEEQEEIKKYSGRVSVNSYLTIRKEPSASSEGLGKLYNNEKVVIIGDVIQNDDRSKWYKIEFNNSFAYVSADYIVDVTIVVAPPEYKEDATFEENLTKQNFPESYKILLRELHAAHPEWIFLSDQIDLTWAEVLDAESSIGKSLVSTSRPESYRAMEYGAYNWETNSYVAFDGSSWVAAHRDIVAYYLEPRNFLNETGIFQFLDQSFNEKFQNIAGIEKIITNSFLAKPFPETTHSSYAEVILEAGRQSKVSPYVLAAMIIQEQGRGGTSDSISGTYNNELKGFFNFFNIGAYTTSSLTAVQRGLMYARGDFATDKNKIKYNLPWNSRAKSIIGGSIWFGSGYIEVGQDTLYYKKFDLIGPNYYNHQYMTNIQAAYTESLIMKNAYTDIMSDSTALTFSIPVFKDMPETNTTSLPSNNGANNYFLTNLSIEGQDLTPNFSKYTNNYELVVSYPVSSINISATPVNGASVSGTGKHDLVVGTNTINVTVTAASGKTSDYILTVVRQEDDGTIIIPDPTISSVYNVGTYITGVSPLITLETFKENFKVSDGTLKIFDVNNKEKSTGNIVTGDKVIVYKNDETEFLNKEIVIYGDTNGDGNVNIIDLALIQKHILKKSSQEGIYAISGDVNKDNNINIIDLALLQKHILKKSLISQ